MIKQFRSLSFINIALLLILTFILRVGIFLQIPKLINSGFYNFSIRIRINFDLDSWLSPTLNIFIATLIIFIQALIFNKIINTFGILNKASFLSGLLYVVCASVFIPFLILSPPLVCNFLLLFIFYKLLKDFKSTDSISTMFDLGMVVAIGTIIYFPFVIFILLLWIALIIFKPFNWREWVAVALGFFTIVFLLGVYYYWDNQILNYLEIWKPLSSKIPFYLRINVLDYIVLFPIAICSILGIISIRLQLFKSFVFVRKMFQLLVFMFFIAIISFYFNKEFRIYHFILAVIPIAMVLAHYFTNATKRWFYETLFLIMIGFIIYFQIF
jgi:hypothetical protein